MKKRKSKRSSWRRKKEPSEHCDNCESKSSKVLSAVSSMCSPRERECTCENVDPECECGDKDMCDCRKDQENPDHEECECGKDIQCDCDRVDNSGTINTTGEIDVDLPNVPETTSETSEQREKTPDLSTTSRAVDNDTLQTTVSECSNHGENIIS